MAIGTEIEVPVDSSELEPGETEEIYVLISGEAEIKVDGENKRITDNDVLFLKPGDTFSMSSSGDELVTLIHCWAQA